MRAGSSARRKDLQFVLFTCFELSQQRRCHCDSRKQMHTEQVTESDVNWTESGRSCELATTTELLRQQREQNRPPQHSLAQQIHPMGQSNLPSALRPTSATC